MTKNNQRGQAIIIMAVALIALLGFAGLAFDGGNLYTEQRRAQSAADNAALAAAYQYMTGVAADATLQSAALTNAAQNDFDNNGTNNVVTYSHPPISGAYIGNPNYFQVTITETLKTVLIHLVYKGPVQVTVTAVSFARPGGSPVSGNAIVALDKTGCGIVQSNGGGNPQTSGIATTGGGIFANSNGSQCTGGNDVLDTNGNNATIHADPAYGISVVATSHAYGSNVDPVPTTGAQQIQIDPLADLALPDCAAGPGTSPQSGTIIPGTYGSLSAHGNLTLLPGLYCIMDTGNNVINLVGNSSSISGVGVTLYVPYGKVDLQGGQVTIKAPSATRNSCTGISEDTASPCHYLGVAFYLGMTNTQGISLSGNASWVVEGTIYNPNSTLELIGNGDWSLTGQVLSKNVVASGNGVIGVVFDPNVIYMPPPSVSLQQ